MASTSSMAAAAMRRPATLRRCLLGTASTNTPRFYASVPSRSTMGREMGRSARQSAKKTDNDTMSAIQRRANNDYFKGGGGPLFPGTFIPLPITNTPRNPSLFLLYQFYRLKQFGIEFLSLLNFKLKSMPNWTTRPKWKASRSRIAPTAKVMYTDMLSAFAAGDKATINRLCLGSFAKKLTAAIDRRNPAEKTNFAVVSYNKPLFYPRVVAHQVHQVNPHNKEMMTEQAVVAIASTQKAARHSVETGKLIMGSSKVQDKIEYVVLSRQVSDKTFQATEWRIWGTVPPTTLKAYREEQDWLKVEQSKRAGWQGPGQK